MPLASLLRLVALAALWGGSFLFMRIVSPVLGPAPTAFGRVAIAAAGLGLAVLVALPAGRRRFGGRLGRVLLLGALNSGTPFLLFAFAVGTLTAGHAAILNATAPLMGVAIGAAFFGERADAAKVAGIGLGLAGVVVLTGAGSVAPTAAVWIAVAASLGATSAYGLAGFLARRWLHGRDPLPDTLVAFGSQVGAALFLAPWMAVAAVRAPVDPAALGAGTLGALLALGLGCTALAYVLYFRLLADVGPIRSLAVTFLVPLFGVLWGRLFLGEPLGWAHAAGGGLIAVALGLVLRRPPARAADAAPAA
jgi:drug/metabolite transporter (DMT)-like permease